MKKFLLSAFFVIGFASYAFYNYSSAQAGAPVASAISVTNTLPVTPLSVTDTQVAASSPPPNTVKTSTPITSRPVPVPIPAKKPAGQYTDGTYTGSIADAYYGSVQVQAVVSSGKLAEVTFLQYPNDRSTSRFINQQAMPMLKAEAIQAQNANVDGVSGASDTSAAFKQSLSSALTQARA